MYNNDNEQKNFMQGLRKIMRLISVDQLKEDMIIAKTIIRSNGTTLLGEGKKIKKNYIQRLKELGITEIYIKDSVKNNIKTESEDIIKLQTKKEAIVTVEELMGKVHFGRDIEVNRVKVIINEIIDELLYNDNILIKIADIRSVDDYTFGHCVNVGILSIATGISLGYTKDDLISLGIGGILHDIGKAKIAAQILNKPSGLTDNEYTKIKKHSQYGYDILKEYTDLDESICNIALYHHERYDGQGYPQGIKGEELHEFVKIVSIADVYDALTSNRSYKKKIPAYNAIEYIKSMSNHQFDGFIVKKFIENIALYPVGTEIVLNNGLKGYILESRKEFPTRPLIRITYDNNKEVPKSYELDLIDHKSLVIIDAINDIYK